jgi:hypothetical protein
MAEKKSDQIKIYVVMGLAMVLLISMYFRFIHAKAGFVKDGTPSIETSARFEVPQVDMEAPRNDRGPEPVVNGSLSAVIRDIFMPLKSPTDAERKARGQEPTKHSPSLKLKGTIVGAGRPMAIVNDQFVYVGDLIGQYRVERITKDNIVLNSRGHHLVLEVMKNKEKTNKEPRG